MIVEGQTVTGMAWRVAWPQLLELVGHREDERDTQRGIAAQRAHIDRITVGPVAKRGSHTFDDSTVSITWRTPVDRAGERSPTRLVGPRIQLELRGRGSPNQPTAERDA